VYKFSYVSSEVNNFLELLMRYRRWLLKFAFYVFSRY
jgi:hypothetical protein